jgi:hypothetical protein
VIENEDFRDSVELELEAGARLVIVGHDHRTGDSAFLEPTELSLRGVRELGPSGELIEDRIDERRSQRATEEKRSRGERAEGEHEPLERAALHLRDRGKPVRKLDGEEDQQGRVSGQGPMQSG